MRITDTRESGFTLIEIMVVVVIIGLLAGLVVPRVLNQADEARLAKVRVQLSALKSALNLYRLDNGRYPTTVQGLEALVTPPVVPPEAPHWRKGGYLDADHVPVDPWGHPFVYVSPGQGGHPYELLSLGADGQEGGDELDEDISVWALE